MVSITSATARPNGIPTPRRASFSRGVEGQSAGRFTWAERPRAVELPRRYAAVIHLLSIELNQRIRLRAFCEDDAFPVVPSITPVWPGADWFERETFDLFGIIFDGHPDLRRILTDYGFVGHPFRKDFPLIGNVEVRYDPEQKRVVYEPVSIEPRVLVPRTIRNDADLDQARAESADHWPGELSRGRNPQLHDELRPAAPGRARRAAPGAGDGYVLYRDRFNFLRKRSA